VLLFWQEHRPQHFSHLTQLWRALALDGEWSAFKLIKNFSIFFFFAAFQTPRISEHPTDMTIPRNDPVTLNCKAEGSPNPNYFWYKDGVLLKASQHRTFLPTGSLFFLKVSFC
jgi:hypothetical protein